MYVIYPADELILMTYGFFAPRVKPRPSLDCLREPLVPIEYPERGATTATTTTTGTATSKTKNSTAAATSRRATAFTPTPIQFQFEVPGTSPSLGINQHPQRPVPSPVYTSFFSFEEQPPPVQSPPQSQSLPPTPTRRASRSSLTHSNHSHTSGKRSSVRSGRLPPASMYNDASQMQGNSATGPGRAPFQRSSAAYDDEAGALGGSLDYGAGQLVSRSRSPSIFLEPPTPDPTHAHFGPGWGRPMSPMDLPPEKSSSSGVGSGIGASRSPTSKSRLRPKLHLPLGRLGRSTSSDTRESNRLREDVHVHVENPVFSSENLRQNNFDAFFEAREPVIKLHPLTPNTVPAEGGRGYSPPLEGRRGVYDSPRTRSPVGKSGGAGGDLFARSAREDRDRMANARSRSADQYDGAATGLGPVLGPGPGTGAGAGAVESGSNSAGGGGGGSAGAHSKGDRFFGKIFKWSKKS
ncbi:flocculation protein FLO11-like [Drosophila madeirensis]|uniref:Flocculation protein FLO11-like n=1 Tax=Drosophila madeirensis TaxID=30013 RepID=A0AAU9G5U0_DROMD